MTRKPLLAHGGIGFNPSGAVQRVDHLLIGPSPSGRLNRSPLDFPTLDGSSPFGSFTGFHSAVDFRQSRF